MIFVDTGPLLARYLANDALHERAGRIWKNLRRTPILTTNHVLDEVFTLVARRAGYSFAVDRAEAVYRSSALEIIFSTKDDEVAALRWMRKYSDHHVSFTDCTSFAVMHRLGVRRAFSFDHHFELAGFQTLKVHDTP